MSIQQIELYSADSGLMLPDQFRVSGLSSYDAMRSRQT
jgi:hypothetical protein